MSAAFLEASSEYLRVASAPVTAAPISVSCLFNTPNTTTSRVFVSIANSGATNQYFGLVAGSGSKVLWQSRATSAGSATTTDTFSVDTWHHAGGVEISATSRFAYLNGVASPEDTTSRTPTGMDRAGIGALVDSSPSNYFEGSIAEVGIWNVVLTAAEWTALAARYSPLFIRPKSLVAYCPLIRGSTDLIGGVSWETQGTPTTSAHPRIIRPSAQILQFPAAAAGAAPFLPFYPKRDNVLLRM